MATDCELDSQGIEFRYQVQQKNGVFWDVAPCGSCKNRRFGGTYRLLHQGRVRPLLVTASIVPSSPIFVTLMKEALSSSETSLLTRATRRNTAQDDILHGHRSENLKSYIGATYVSLTPKIYSPAAEPTQARGSSVIKALHHKSEGCEFETR
jgi:hypothetical protein